MIMQFGPSNLPNGMKEYCYNDTEVYYIEKIITQKHIYDENREPTCHDISTWLYVWSQWGKTATASERVQRVIPGYCA